jgi:hypothetical protein
MATQNTVKDTDMNEYYIETAEAGAINMIAGSEAQAIELAIECGYTVLSINEC